MVSAVTAGYLTLSRVVMHPSSPPPPLFTFSLSSSSLLFLVVIIVIDTIIIKFSYSRFYSPNNTFNNTFGVLSPLYSVRQWWQTVVDERHLALFPRITPSFPSTPRTPRTQYYTVHTVLHSTYSITPSFPRTPRTQYRTQLIVLHTVSHTVSHSITVLPLAPRAQRHQHQHPSHLPITQAFLQNT